MTDFPTLAELKKEEIGFVKPSFSFEDGLSIALSAVEKARGSALPIVVDVFAWPIPSH